MSVYLELFHGRNSPGEELDDWGFEGPVIGPLPYVHVTYGCDLKFGDEHIALIDGLVEFKGSYYGDFSVFGESKLLDRDTVGGHSLNLKVDRTAHVLNLAECMLPLEIHAKEQWVRNYVAWVMKGRP